jgi:hypothetical protein
MQSSIGLADWKSIRQIEHRFFSEPETLTS